MTATNTSKTAIANLALYYLGKSRINDIDTPTDESSRVMNQIFDSTRIIVLRLNDWNFAKAKLTLAENTIAPINGWSKSFSLPSDFVKACQVNDSTAYAYEIVGDNLYANEGVVILDYIKDEQDPNKYDALFLETFAAKLAHTASFRLLRGSLSKINALEEMFNRFLRQARNVGSQEENDDDQYYEGSWVRAARYGESI